MKFIINYLNHLTCVGPQRKSFRRRLKRGLKKGTKRLQVALSTKWGQMHNFNSSLYKTWVILNAFPPIYSSHPLFFTLAIQNVKKVDTEKVSLESKLEDTFRIKPLNFPFTGLARARQLRFHSEEVNLQANPSHFFGKLLKPNPRIRNLAHPSVSSEFLRFPSS